MNPKCVDFVLAYRPCCLESSCVIETTLSNFYKMTVTVLKSYFQKAQPKISY